MIRRFVPHVAVALLILLPAFGAQAQDGQPAPENVEKLKKGIEHFQAGRGKEAMDLYNEVIAAEPKWEGPLIWRAQLWLAAGQFREANKDANAALNLRPDSSDAFHLRAQSGLKIRMTTTNTPARAKLLAEAILKDASAAFQANHAPATALLVMQAQYLLGKKEEAEKGFAALLKQAPPDQELGLRMAILGARIEVQDYGQIEIEATWLIDKLKDHPKTPELLVVRAEHRIRIGHWKDAEQDLDEAVRRMPALKEHAKLKEVRAELETGAPDRALWPVVELLRLWSADPTDAAARAALAKEFEARIKDDTYVLATFLKKGFLHSLPEELRNEMGQRHIENALLSKTDALAEIKAASEAYERLTRREKDDVAPLLAVAEKYIGKPTLGDAQELRGRIRLDAGDFAGAAQDFSMALLITDFSSIHFIAKPASRRNLVELKALIGLAARFRDKAEMPEDRIYREGREFELRADPVQCFVRWAELMIQPSSGGKSFNDHAKLVEAGVKELVEKKSDLLLRECKNRAERLHAEKPEEALRYLIAMERQIWRGILHEDQLTDEERAERFWNLNLQADLLFKMPDRAERFLEVSKKVERLRPFDLSNHLRHGMFLERAGKLRQALFFYNTAILGEEPDPKAANTVMRIAGQKFADLKKSMDPKEVNIALSIGDSITVDSKKIQNPNTSSNAGMVAACTVFLRNPSNNQAYLRKTRGMRYAFLMMWDKAIVDLEEAVRLDKAVYVAVNLVDAYEARGRFQDALDEIARTDKIPFDNKSGFEMLAEQGRYLCLRRAKLELALKHYDRADQEINAGLKIGWNEGQTPEQMIKAAGQFGEKDILDLFVLQGDILLARGDREGALKSWAELIGKSKPYARRFIGEKIKAAGGTNPYDEPKTSKPEEK